MGRVGAAPQVHARSGHERRADDDGSGKGITRRVRIVRDFAFVGHAAGARAEHERERATTHERERRRTGMRTSPAGSIPSPQIARFYVLSGLSRDDPDHWLLALSTR
jgi:hypothetical protein